jgi:hypothetical protein
MENLAALALVWALIFAMLLLPARKVGTWIARPPDGFVGTTLSIMLCFMLAWSVVLFGWLALKVGGREIFPHVKADYFGVYYVALLLLAPAFAVLVTGYLHARMVAGRRTLNSFVPAKAKDLLSDLSWLAISVAFLGFGSRSLLRWYETGQFAARYRDVTYAGEPYLFAFEFFRSGFLVVAGLFGILIFFGVRRYRRQRLQFQRRENRDLR